MKFLEVHKRIGAILILFKSKIKDLLHPNLFMQITLYELMTNSPVYMKLEIQKDSVKICI